VSNHPLFLFFRQRIGTWSRITPASARWDQAFSFDAGKNWDTNWMMEFKRAP